MSSSAGASQGKIAAAASPKVEEHEGCGTFSVEFDFGAKAERAVPLATCPKSMEAGKFVWIDVDVTNGEAAKKLLSGLNLVQEEVLEAALTNEAATQLSKYDDYLHVVVTGCRLYGLHFDLERVDVVIGEKFLLTMHRGATAFLDEVKRGYRADFYRFARSPSFLIYEIWDHLIENYLNVQKQFEERVSELQRALMRDVNDKTFAQVSELGADLLHFRKVLLPARAVLTELSTRKSVFISEATQPFLGNMVGTLERVLGDLMVDRDILSESLNLYMSIVGHRTNETMKYLTVMSAVFLPLAFVVGFFGQNFESLPGMSEWNKSNVLMWVMIIACLITPIGMITWFRMKKWM